ncbi:MAG: hypothetical protein JXR73_19710 [Candidatus Omnitrophica bacterium]|nr:hypothetical protein [Candidatus Omnitrophota bacterium]
MNKMLPICLSLLLVGAAGGWCATPTAVDIEALNTDESSIYVLYSDGYLQANGFAVSYGYPSNIDAVDLTLTQSGKGYYILESDGVIHQYGDAVQINGPMPDADNPFVDMELFGATNSPYLLQQDGSIVTAGNAVFYGESIRKADAVDLELSSDGLGYYVLYEDGVIAFFGTALNRGYTETGGIPAVDLELTGNGYYVSLSDGSILSFGDALPMPFRTLPDDDVIDMIITKQGYRILTKDGEVENFIRVDAQSGTSWYAQVAARSIPQQATPTPTRTPSPSVNYFNFTDSGYSEKIIGRIPEGSTLPDSLDNGYASLFGGGLFIAASDGEELPARKILYYGLEDSTSQSSTGKVFASLAPERGAAEIRGMAYSRAGLYVVVQDDSGTFVFLLEGQYEDADVAGFTIY